MGRSISSSSVGATGSLTSGSGQVLQAKAGSVSITQNDLVALGGVPVQLYPVQTSDYAAVAAAGASAVALTTFSAIGTQFETRDRAVVDPATGDIFIADTYLTGPVGCQIWKYNSAGTLQRALILDSASTGGTNHVQTMFLSNGDILVLWNNVATPYTLFFAIVDKFLSVVVGKTTIASAATNPQIQAGCIALNGGGFAIAWGHATVGSYFTIRNNAGAVVYGPTLITGAPANTSGNSNGPRFKLVQLSNNNIFVGINDTYQTDAGRYCIFDPVGNLAKAYTVLTGHGNGGSGYPEMGIVTGFVCMVIPGNRAYVFNNAGTLQGAPLALAGTVARVKNDGANFWVFTYSSGLVISRVQTSGSGPVSNTLAAITGLVGDVLYERDQWITFDSSNAHIISVAANAFPSILSSSAFGSVLQTIGGIGDFCAIGFQVGKFQVTKYLNASILGVAQTDVAAGNAGTLVTVAAGAGGCITNEIRGSVGKTYDHSAATIVGNKGAMYLNSVTLKGI